MAKLSDQGEGAEDAPRPAVRGCLALASSFMVGVLAGSIMSVAGLLLLPLFAVAIALS